jgi:hypothetical protein
MNSLPWKYSKTVAWSDGYVAVCLAEHPNAMNGRYVFEHRVVMENMLGRLLGSEEHVHHINEIKSDNRPENLQVLSAVEHMSLHHGTSEQVKMRCVSCTKTFYMLACKHKDFSLNPRTRERKFHACSKSCQVKFQQKLRFEGMTEEAEESINKNTLEGPRIYDFTKEQSENGRLNP